MGRGITPALLGIVAGTALQLQQGQLWPWSSYAGVLVLSLPLLLWERAGVRAIRLSFAAGLLAFALVGLRSIAFESRALDPLLEGQDVAVTGMVAAMPQRTESGIRFRFEVESSSAPLPPQILLGWYGPAATEDPGSIDLSRTVPDLRAGERWRFTVRLKAPHGNVNPHGFDYELWLWEQGIQATGYVRAGPRDAKRERIDRTWQHPVERARQAVRDDVFRRVDDRRTAGVLAALITGDQNAIDRGDWDIFRATGVAHLLSISGLHITMFAWAAALVVGLAWRRSSRLCLAWPAQNAALVGGVVLASAYALFSGWGVPAQRTIWMLATVGVLRLTGRRWPWTHVWLLACAVVVTIDPWAMLQAGFWLSFVAVGVLFAADPGAQRDEEGSKVVQTLRSALHEQWVVTVALTPLGVLLFGQVSVVGLLANAVAIPWVTLVVTPLAMAGVALNASWDLAAGAISWLQAYLEWLALLPFATLSMPAAPLWAGALGVSGGLLLAMRLPWHARGLGVALMLPVLLWQPPRPATGEFDVLAADIGQGNALVVRTALHTLVYDSGPRYGPESDAGHRVVVPLLRAFDEHIDMLMLSHRDSDHTGGAAAILAMQPQAALVSSIEDGHELQAVRKSARCIAGQHWQWDGVEFAVLHPESVDYDAPAKPNSMSCVLRISNGKRTALLVGDLEAPQEARLVDAAAPLRADVMLVPHHGSKTSSSAAFLDAVHPSFALVQAGYRNRFGHPAPPVVDRYRERSIPVIDSPHCGAARWSSAQPDRVACERDVQPHYWLHRAP
ncbi:MAG TPA: DNA internalization-related competence protein ComEC/Rec2 [Ramlibacter sp.]|nr:DNA internalization-related competence protein ComEC/Rec2 [Ramlibacter sp.]